MYLRGNSIGTDDGRQTTEDRRQTTDDRRHTLNLSFYRMHHGICDHASLESFMYNQILTDLELWGIRYRTSTSEKYGLQIHNLFNFCRTDMLQVAKMYKRCTAHLFISGHFPGIPLSAEIFLIQNEVSTCFLCQKYGHESQYQDST